MGLTNMPHRCYPPINSAQLDVQDRYPGIIPSQVDWSLHKASLDRLTSKTKPPIMPTYNKQSILQSIQEMKAICSDGKKEVTKLVEAIIGEPLAQPIEPAPRQVWKTGSGLTILLVPANSACSSWNGYQDTGRIWTDWVCVTTEQAKSKLESLCAWLAGTVPTFNKV